MDIATLLGSYAFPVVACIAMAWYCKDVSDKNREDIKEINSQHITDIKELDNQHSDEMIVFKDALDNNTKALERLCDKLDN